MRGKTRVRRTEFYYLDAAASGLFEQHVLRLEVAVNQSIAVQQIEAEEDRMCKLAHQRHAKTLQTCQM